MPGSLEDKIQRSGNVAEMLRNSPAGAYTYPMKPEFSNWGDEQAAWQHDRGPVRPVVPHDRCLLPRLRASGLLRVLAVNSFATFGPDKAKQLVTVNPTGTSIGDGILFGLGKEEFSLVGRPAAPD